MASVQAEPLADDTSAGDAKRPVILWFRDDLRLSDNPALQAASQSGRPIMTIYVHDEHSQGVRPLGGAARWWLHGSLLNLDHALRRRGGSLSIHTGSAATIVPRLAARHGAATVFWNRRYGGAERSVDEAVKSELKAQQIQARSFNGHLLYEPWTVKTKSGGPFRVFSAFWRAAHIQGEPELPLPIPSRLQLFANEDRTKPQGEKLEELKLEPSSPDWAGGLRSSWKRGEDGAEAQLQRFLDQHLGHYADFRDYPERRATSRLSPYLRFGNISARQVWHSANAAAAAVHGKISHQNLEKFQSELGWREFSYHLLYHNPDLATANLQRRFDGMPWQSAEADLEAWQRGRTGYPMVDAGMRELWATGWMHNRVRMVVASFLVKHLLIDWRQGEAWFWDTLVDADPANNAASWQWVAGSGADAAPYFRIFNPVLQGEKFDGDGTYARRWLPELADLSASVVHRPWSAKGGQTAAPREAYPARIVDHDSARRRALEAYSDLG